VTGWQRPVGRQEPQKHPENILLIIQAICDMYPCCACAGNLSGKEQCTIIQLVVQSEQQRCNAAKKRACASQHGNTRPIQGWSAPAHQTVCPVQFGAPELLTPGRRAIGSPPQYLNPLQSSTEKSLEKNERTGCGDCGPGDAAERSSVSAATALSGEERRCGESSSPNTVASTSTTVDAIHDNTSAHTGVHNRIRTRVAFARVLRACGRQQLGSLHREEAHGIDSCSTR